MTMHKISAYFNNDLDVDWPCPSCHQKTLQIVKDTFKNEDSAETRQSWAEDWFDYEMHRAVFVCMAKCTRTQCKEIVACSGIGGTEMVYDEEYDWRPECYFQPKFFSPTLHPFLITEKCVKEIKKPLIASFSVYFSQPGAAANLIRITVERLLTAIGIPDKNDKGRDINLHSRINSLEGQYAPYKEPLMAIKFLGNAGSHTYDGVKTNDIEDAYEIMEYVTNDLFSGKKEAIEMLSERLSTKFDQKKQVRKP